MFKNYLCGSFVGLIFVLNLYFATSARGLESIAAAELESLGAQNIRPDFTGVHFSGDRTLLYRVNLWARTIFRVLVPIKEIKSYNAQQLYREVQKISWQEYLSPEQTLAVRCTGGNQHLNHTHFSALGIKNAIIDQQRQQTGKRSSIDTKNPDLFLNAHIYQNRCILSLDSSGNSLHRRGYRPAVGVAPLKETLAAAILELTTWQPNLPLLDPLCGSGTLPIEAGLKSLNIAPGLFRPSFAFHNWRDFEPSLWEKLRQEALNAQLNNLPAKITGCDRNTDIIEQARNNAQLCGLQPHLNFAHQELSRLEAPADCGIIVCNPPYGKRIGQEQELGALYKLLGDVFKQRFKGWTAYVLTGNKQLAKRIGLKASRRFPVYNGSLPCTLLKYELY